MVFPTTLATRAVSCGSQRRKGVVGDVIKTPRHQGFCRGGRPHVRWHVEIKNSIPESPAQVSCFECNRLQTKHRRKRVDAAGERGGVGHRGVACQYWNKSPQKEYPVAVGNGRGVRGGPEGSAPPRAVTLRSVVACEKGEWQIHLHHKTTHQDRMIPFKCRSWRHPGLCRLWKGAQDFCRVRDAVKARPGGWVYVVLTFDPSKWEDPWSAYKGSVRCWDRLRKRLKRSWGPVAYVQTWERHKSGWPHVNILIHNEALAAACAGDGWKNVRSSWLEPNAIASGFGMRTWIEPIRDQDAVAGYMTKLSRELVGAATKDQVPENAPPHFRRLRASHGLLPPVLGKGEYTGELLIPRHLHSQREDCIYIGTRGLNNYAKVGWDRKPGRSVDRVSLLWRLCSSADHEDRERVSTLRSVQDDNFSQRHGHDHPSDLHVSASGIRAACPGDRRSRRREEGSLRSYRL